MKSFALLAALVAAAFAQHWDIEQVDSAGWGAGVQMRWHPDGRLLLFYSDTTGTIRLASFDTTWHYESVPSRFHPDPRSQAFDVNLQGDVGITYVYDSGVRFIEKTDTGWVDMSGSTLQGGRPLPAYRLDGGFSYIQDIGLEVVNVSLDDTVWRVDTVADQVMARYYQTWTNRVLADGMQVCTITWDDDVLLMGGLFYCVRRDSMWQAFNFTSVLHGGFGAVGCDVDAADSIRLCYWEDSSWPHPYGYFRYQGMDVDSVWTTLSALDIDTLNRPQIAYARPDLRFTFSNSSGWHYSTVDTTRVAALDLALSDGGQPLIAYATSAGLFLARGVDVVGQSEERGEPTAYSLQLTATVVRGVLRIGVVGSQQSAYRGELLDAAGRNVLVLKAGANDVSRLPPGIYFVRSAVSGGRTAVSKVLVAR